MVVVTQNKEIIAVFAIPAHNLSGFFVSIRLSGVRMDIALIPIHIDVISLILIGPTLNPGS